MLPLGQPRAIAGSAAHAIHALGKLGRLVEVIHPRAVFLAKRDLALVLQLGTDAIAQGGVFGRLAKLRQRGGVFLRDKLLRGGVLQIF